MRKILFLLISLLFISCNSKPKNQIASQVNSDAQKISNTVSEKINSKFLEVVSDWKEYQNFQEFLLNNFKNTDSQKVLNNAKDLNEYAKSLKDSILPKKINYPSFEARLNLLYTETLRLSDMSTISAIKSEEVALQAQKIFDAYSFMNAKINAILEQQELERLYGDDSNLARLNLDQKPESKKISKPQDRKKSSNLYIPTNTNQKQKVQKKKKQKSLKKKMSSQKVKDTKN